MAAKDAKVLAVLGSGVQARSHVEALRIVRDFEEIRVWSRTPEHAERFARAIGANTMGPAARARASASWRCSMDQTGTILPEKLTEVSGPLAKVG
jgi:thiomorpholine-carboxylate dehydrogenase